MDTPAKKCIASGCTRPARAKGYCASHYAQVRKGQPLTALEPLKQCSVEGCTKLAEAKGVCWAHYQRVRRGSTNTSGRLREMNVHTELAKTRVRPEVAKEIEIVALQRDTSPYVVIREILDDWYDSRKKWTTPRT